MTLSPAFTLAVAAAALVVAQATPPQPASAPPSPSPSPAAWVSPAAWASPDVAPTPAYHFVYRPTPSPVTTPFPLPNAPEIDEIDLNEAALVPPAPLHVRVLTNPTVVSVNAETFGRSIAIPQHDRGIFTFDGYIPNVPDFLRNRTYAVSFIAASSDGRTASVTLPLTLK
jgi:hypothetical protein